MAGLIPIPYKWKVILAFVILIFSFLTPLPLDDIVAFFSVLGVLVRVL